MKDIASFVALNRFGLGARQQEADISNDPRGWVKAQIGSETALDLDHFRSSADILAEIHNARAESSDALRRVTRNSYRQDFSPAILARAQLMVTTDEPFIERMVLFWSNHFTVSNTKRIMGPAIPAYEREAIRPHVFGRFADMLKAVSRHPVMISYLDNSVSIGENSAVGRRRMARSGAKKTLNENLAREILELHTLGVSGGYNQEDVIELGKAISGWSHGGVRFRRETRPVSGGFEFRANFHEPGAKKLLGKTYLQDGPTQGLRMLDDLARHPSTANFIATKLVRHFVSDTPPPQAIERIAQVFSQSDGDLAAVSAVLVDLDEVWAEPLPKVKNHYEFVISLYRAVGHKTLATKDFFGPMREFGQMPFTAPSPAGWADKASAWVSPEALMRRIQWVRSLSGRLPLMVPPDQFLDAIIGPVAHDETRGWVSLAPSTDSALSLILASPEFQRR